MNIQFKKLHVDAVTPIYSHDNDGGFDLCASESITLAPMQRASVPTGIALAIPDGYVGLVWDKSGVSHKGGIKTLGGVVDAGYRGEIFVGVINLSDKAYTFEKWHKVAQMIIQERIKANFVEVDMLDDTTRGEKGFGSTGK